MRSKEARATAQRDQMAEQDREVFGIVQDNSLGFEAMQRANEAIEARLEQVNERRFARRSAGRERKALAERNVVLVWILSCIALLCLTICTDLFVYVCLAVPISSMVIMARLGILASQEKDIQEVAS